jgi:hypothetical protein
MLRSIPPTDPVLVLGIIDGDPDKADPNMLRDLFGFSRANRFTIKRPSKVSPITIKISITMLIIVAKSCRLLPEHY